ncbi:hypothetical protein TrVE_jg12639 [Triparma verrucosa]|uniref:J domain-containing protein n=1 Tax=Triparma verrucosa TaxID=1606542 RepID=A0A9W7KRQ4_9STRA|nr:hypothetical protein TrVE_jg12639 [Triparma verrucosa]
MYLTSPVARLFALALAFVSLRTFDCLKMNAFDEMYQKKATLDLVEEEEVGDAPSSSSTISVEDEDSETPGAGEKKENNVLEELDWGQNYDPNDQFCGKYDCYAVLGLDYETSKGEGTLTKSEISQVYRAMSRKYHPDKLIAKQKGMSKRAQKKLRSRFVYIAKAHEVLQDPERKMSYDYYHKAPNSEYDAAFGKSYSVHFAPTSPLSMVIMGIILALSVLSYVLRRNKYDVIKGHVVVAAVNDFSNMEGGGTESIWTRDKCLELMKVVLGKEAIQEEKANKGKGGKKVKKGSKADSPKKENGEGKEKDAAVDRQDEALVAKLKEASSKADIDPKKLNKKEITKKYLELFCPIVVEMSYDDFGGGYRKPKVPDDLFAYMFVVFLFVDFPKWVAFWVRFHYRRLKKIEYDDGEIEYFTKKSMRTRWDILTDEDKVAALKRELWIEENLDTWDYEMDVRLYGQKKANLIRKFKKEGSGGMEDYDY